MYKSRAIKILEAFERAKCLSNRELNKIAWWRFSGYLHQLKQYWIKFTKVKGSWYLEIWSIQHIPENLKWKWRTSIKVIQDKRSWFERLFTN